jgi:cation diffusion facilitator CzcD-associated flavoprotein CzcO
MRIPGGKAVQRLISQAYVELIFPLATHYFTVNPLITQMDEAGKGYLRKQVRDPTARDALTPRYGVGCKRPGFHNTYFSTFNRENVRLITEPIDKITGAGVATTDGESHDIDVLILATGFKVTDTDNVPTYPVTGLGGRSLAQFWDENRLQAYEGVSIPGFPNLFTVYGPYGFVGSSYFAVIEAQAHHIVRCLRRARQAGLPGGGHSGSQRPLFRRDAAQAAPADLLAGHLASWPIATTSTRRATWRCERPALACRCPGDLRIL